MQDKTFCHDTKHNTGLCKMAYYAAVGVVSYNKFPNFIKDLPLNFIKSKQVVPRASLHDKTDEIKYLMYVIKICIS